ncbi:MAG: DUF2782 domain-containing protein [Pseudomonadota bacterium]|nr:DUF2782 domain-containing protein [Pseudomonadota bacterium]
MKTTALLASTRALVASSLLLSGLLASAVFAQTRPSTNVPPPPGMNDPGVTAVTPPSPAPTQTAPSTSGHMPDLKPQALPSMKSGDSRLGRPKGSVPDVQVRQDGDNSVQEYSRNGQVYMVVVTPKSGIAQTYMVDPQGRMVDEHGQKPVRPVMYKVLEWGKAPPPAEPSSNTPTPDSGH